MTNLSQTPLGGLLRLIRQPISRWPLAFEAATELVMMKVMVKCVAPARYASLLGGGECWPKERISNQVIKDSIWAIESVGRYAPPFINCLPRALALQRMLKRRGVRGTIRFGVKRENDKVKAHAWLVLDEIVLVGRIPDLDSYAPFPGWPDSLFR